MKCIEAFKLLKKPPITPVNPLSMAQPHEKLYIYLAISRQVVSVILFQNEKNKETPICYVSKALLNTKLSYTQLE